MTTTFRWETMTRAGPPEWGSVSDTLFPGSSSSPPAGPNSPPWTGETDGSQRDYITLTCINVPPGVVTLPLEVLGTTGVGQFAIATASNNGGSIVWDTDGGATIPLGSPTELNVVQADGLVLPTVTHTGGWLTLQVIVSPTVPGGIPGTADIWWGRLEAPTWPTVLPVGPSSPPFTSTWTPGENIFDPPGALNLHIAWAPAGLYTVTIETTGTTAGVSGMVFDVLDPLGVRVPLVDTGGAVANLPIGYVAAPGAVANPTWNHAGGPIRLRMFGIGAGAGTATATWGPASTTLPADATVPTGTPGEWDTVGGTTTQPPAYTPPTDLTGWHTNETEGTTLVLEATGLTEGQEIVVPIRCSAGDLRLAILSPTNFRPSLIDRGGVYPDPLGDGVRVVGSSLVAPRWQMVADGDVRLTIELVGTEPSRVVTFAPWLVPTGGGGGLSGNQFASLANLFPEKQFRDGIHFAMDMGDPDADRDTVHFHWDEVRQYAIADSNNLPFDLDDPKTILEPAFSKQTLAALEFVSRSTLSGGTPVGQFDSHRVKITLLDTEYEEIKGFDWLDISGNKYDLDFVEPVIGLFGVSVYILHASARDES